MMNVRCARVGLVLVTLVACGGNSRRDPAATGGSGGSGERVFNGEPESCTTGAGDLGMFVDVFPYPPGPPECIALAQPGDEDPSCPSDSLYVCDPVDCHRAASMPGCCRPNGECGLLEEGYFSFERELGCISRDAWLENEDFLGRDLEPVTCTP
jgi:hypothetical protein